MEIRQDIQLIRGIAVLIVLLFHLQTPFFENGFLGVDIFFVVSGFLMAKLYDRGTVIEFYKRRLNRLIPAYAVTVIVTTGFGFAFLIPVDYAQLQDQSIAASLFVSNLFYWDQNSYFSKAAFNPLLNMWSLAVEAQFYILVPLLYPLIRRSRWYFFIFFGTSLFLCFAIQTVSPKTSFFWMPLRIWEFFIGAWVAWNVSFIARQGIINNDKVKSVAFILFLVLPFVLPLSPDKTGTILSGHPAVPSFVVTILTGFLLALEIPVRIVSSIWGRALCRIGDLSYSIYLIHFPIIVFINYKPFDGTNLEFEDFSHLIIAVGSIFILSVLSYKFIEKKFSETLNLLPVRIGLLISIPFFAIILGQLNLNKYNETERGIFGAWTDRDTYRCGKIFRILNPNNLICELDSENTELPRIKVLLVGNSHADSIKKIFSDTARQEAISTYFVVSNSPLIGGPIANQLIAAAIENNIKAIIFHYSNIYENEDQVALIREFIEQASKSGMASYVIGPVPSYSIHVPKAMFEDKAREFKFRITRDQHKAATEGYTRFVEMMKTGNTLFFDPADLLCIANEGCLIAKSNMRPFYFDSGHLTLTGAQALRPLFKDLIGEVKRRNQSF